MKRAILLFFALKLTQVCKTNRLFGGLCKNKLMKIQLLLAFLLPAIHAFAQQKQQSQYFTKYNPSYHFFPSGDPTGLFYFNGSYYNNWGIASSNDFVHWKLTAQGKEKNRNRELLRDSTIEQSTKDSILRSQVRLGGSGTIIIDRNNSSGFGVNGQPPLISFWHNEVQPWRNQVIGIAYSNDTARTWNRYEKFPILDINSREFRDPKVFWYEPTQKWIMAVGWAEVPKVRFYSSTNLKDWDFLSEFGPWGATGGVWECVDFFPLAVDGDLQKTKWVLTISVQPLNGQYFIGNFDGKRFTLDQNFIKGLTHNKYLPNGIVLFDFETGIDNWEMEGDAFLECPSNQALRRQGAVMGKEGQYFINSYHNEASSIGKITSPQFIISKNFINFKIGGGFAPSNECINLLVDGKIVRTDTGKNSNDLQWSGWDVSAFKGRTAKIEIVDYLDKGTGYNESSGYIYIDHIMMSDELAKTELEKAYWIDYGPDLFAVRSWNNYAEHEKRIVWTGWMGSWRYASLEPVRGIQSVPRNVELKTFPEGVRLVQNPVKELESLRKTHLTAVGSSFEGIWESNKFKPSRNSYELIVEFENISAKEFGLNLCVGNNEKTIVGYDTESEELYVDRRNSGYDKFISLFPQLNKGPLKNRSNTLKLHVFVDNCSVEVFANSGETVISSKIYPDSSSLNIQLFSSKGRVAVKSLDLWELNSIGQDKK